MVDCLCSQIVLQIEVTIYTRVEGGVRTAKSLVNHKKRFPTHGWFGLLVMVLGEILLIAGNHWVRVYFTPIQWTGLILLLDALDARHRGTSVLRECGREFLLLLLISIGSWYIFEGYNLLLKNWVYVGLPSSRSLRYLGYFWSFATISPGIFLMYQVLEDYLAGTGKDIRGFRMSNAVFGALVTFGAACLVVPLLWPSTYMTPLVWMGFAFLLDPINHRLGTRSILAEFLAGHRRSLWIFFLTGLICGFLWEFWNYWAIGKWEYDVPYWGHIKLFEMPVLGFLGFLPFTIECFAIWAFIRRLFSGKGDTVWEMFPGKRHLA